MRRAIRFAIVLALIFTCPAQAQEPAEGQPATSAAAAPVASFDATSLFDIGASEWIIAGGPAWSASILQSVTGHHYALQTVSWGRILMGPRGSGILRGRFEWAIEGVPFYGQYSPQNTYGFGITPLLWRWNFEPVGRLAPYVELGGGALWTRDPVPVQTTTSNFTGQTGAGVRIFVRPSEALVLGYRFHHISNGNRLEANPGVNAHVLQFGWSHLHPRRP